MKKRAARKGRPHSFEYRSGLFQLLRPEEDGAVVILEGVGLVVGLVVGLLHDRIEDALDDGAVGLGQGILRIGQGGRIGCESPEARNG